MDIGQRRGAVSEVRYPNAFTIMKAADAARPPTITVWMALRTGFPVVNMPLMAPNTSRVARRKDDAAGLDGPRQTGREGERHRQAVGHPDDDVPDEFGAGEVRLGVRSGGMGQRHDGPASTVMSGAQGGVDVGAEIRRIYYRRAGHFRCLVRPSGIFSRCPARPSPPGPFRPRARRGGTLVHREGCGTTPCGRGTGRPSPDRRRTFRCGHRSSAAIRSRHPCTSTAKNRGTCRMNTQRNTLDRDRWIAVFPEENNGFRKAGP